MDIELMIKILKLPTKEREKLFDGFIDYKVSELEKYLNKYHANRKFLKRNRITSHK